MRRARWLAVCLLALGAAQGMAAEPLTPRQQDFKTTSDVLRAGIPAAALALTFVLDDRRDPGSEPVAGHRTWYQLGGSPRHDLVLGLARTALVTEALKRSIDARRPNGELRSFPSGHTSIAFSGAEFIRNTYGWGWGAPAYLAAGVVGWARVEADYHHVRDVLAGALIGVLANHDLREWRGEGGATLRLVAAPVVAGRSAAPGLTLVYRR